MNTSAQVLREIDKLDKIGLDGVCDMLGDGRRDESGAFNPGVGLTPIQVGMVRVFFGESAAPAGASNDDRIRLIAKAGERVRGIRSRIELMVKLEQTVRADDLTAWDALLAMPANADQTWNGGGRPENIAWALDDLIGVAT